MQADRRFRVSAGLALAALGLGSVAGCGMLNPSLLVTLGGTPVRSLDSPDGSLIILVMNRTTQVAAARVLVTKQNGGEVELTLPVEPFNAGTDLDHRMAVQDCDVESLQLIQVTATTATGVIEIPSDAPPITTGDGGVELCGKVIAITISGTAPAVFVDLRIH